MRLIDANALKNKIYALLYTQGIRESDILDEIDNAPTIIDCGEMDHEELGKIPYMDLRPKTTNKKLDEIGDVILDWVAGITEAENAMKKIDHIYNRGDQDDSI